MQYQMEASFVEIYNETLRDLLTTSTSDGDAKHEIKMDPSRPGEVYITNITPVQVTSEDQVCGLSACYIHGMHICICNYTIASVHCSRSQGCWSGLQATVLSLLRSVTRGPHAAIVSSD